MVSTDDPEIAGIAMKAGASVPFFRSAEMSGDYASTDEVIMEVLKEYEKNGLFFDRFCCIYPTAPFLTGRRLKSAMDLLNEADSCMPVVPFSYPPQRAMVVREGRLVFFQPEYMDSRSQDLEPHYHDVGQFYVFRTEAFERNRKLMLGNILPFVISELEVQDIDNESDWKIAEMKYKLMQPGE